jgi:hypothetical protein
MLACLYMNMSFVDFAIVTKVIITYYCIHVWHDQNIKTLFLNINNKRILRIFFLKLNR